MWKRALLKMTLLALLPSMLVVQAPAVVHAADQKAVLITGASTGIGRKMAELLAAEGHHVYAGARKQQDLDALNQIANIQAVRLDVTAQEDIDAAVETVRKGGKGLWGLINNAGIGMGGPLTELDEEELKWLFEVNVYGPFRVTQAFAPLIIESKGRISTTGSIAGILAGPLMGPYSMSKHAMEAYTDSLAAEMARFGVHVSIIDPGGYKSKIGTSAARRMQQKGPVRKDSPYAKEMQQFIQSRVERRGQREPDDVAEAALHAMFDPDPKRRYMVVPNLQQATLTIRRSLEKAVELNQDQTYSFSRQELVQMLDDILAGSNP